MKSRRSTANSFPPALLKQYTGEQDEVKMSMPQMAASCPDFPKTELHQHTWCFYTVQLLKYINEIDLICLVPQWVHESSYICNVLNPIFVSDRKRDLFFPPLLLFVLCVFWSLQKEQSTTANTSIRPVLYKIVLLCTIVTQHFIRQAGTRREAHLKVLIRYHLTMSAIFMHLCHLICLGVISSFCSLICFPSPSWPRRACCDSPSTVSFCFSLYGPEMSQGCLITHPESVWAVIGCEAP